MKSDLTGYANQDLSQLGDDEFNDLVASLLEVQADDTKENQIKYYNPVSPKAKAVHFLTADTLGIGGGNGSSKTETSFAEMVMCATGIFPDWALEEMTEEMIRKKAMGPMKCRVILANFKAQLKPMLKKFQWWEWTGILPTGGDKGHWGWIPHSALVGGSWDTAWSAGDSILSFNAVDPYNPERVMGTSSIQFMSKEMDPLSMAGVDLQFVVMDEPSNLSVYKENQARLMRGDGRMFLPMTWQDDAGIEVDWIFEEIYDPAMDEGNPDFAWVTLSSFDNPHLPQERVAKRASQMSDEERRIRIEGDNLRFSNLIHPMFTDRTKVWCFNCDTDTILTTGPNDTPVCSKCQQDDVEPFCHVSEFDSMPNWPCVFIVDPHPRKPHMFQWVLVDPNDDLWQIADGELAEEPIKVAEMAARIEDELGLHVARRLMDPNMGASPCGVSREKTWQTEFAAAGLDCDLADDSGVGRSRLNEYLRCDKNTRCPRIHVHSRCRLTIAQMSKYMWDNFKQDQQRDQKQIPKPKNDDFPNNLKYLVNSDPSFASLCYSSTRINTRVHKKSKKYGSKNRMR